MTIVQRIHTSPYVEATILNPVQELRQQHEVLWVRSLIERNLITPDYYMLYHADDQATTRIVANPLAIITVTAAKISLHDPQKGETVEEHLGPHPLKQVEQLLAQLSLPGVTAYGYIAFELAHYFSRQHPPEDSAAPLLTFFVPGLELHITPDWIQIKAMNTAFLERVIEVMSSAPQPMEFPSGTPEHFATSEQDAGWYMQGVQTLTDTIHREFSTNGPLQKAILSRKVIVSDQGDLDVLDTYRQAIQQNTSVRSYCFQIGKDAAVGCSPETLLEADANGCVSSNPLAGTRWRGATSEEDEALAAELASSHKQRSEHLLSVLEVQRELESICVDGSVQIRGLAHIQKYRTVQHLASHLAGTLQPSLSVWDAVEALFPGITVSGIGKSAALAWIRRLEPTPRGMYAGAVGWIGNDGSGDLAIAIRTIFQRENSVFFQAGAGIVADSEPRDEYEETWHKMQTMWPYFVRLPQQEQ